VLRNQNTSLFQSSGDQRRNSCVVAPIRPQAERYYQTVEGERRGIRSSGGRNCAYRPPPPRFASHKCAAAESRDGSVEGAGALGETFWDCRAGDFISFLK